MNGPEMYDREAKEIAAAFGDALGPDTYRVSLTLALASAYGGGDALAGLLLNREDSPERIVEGLQRVFPTWKPKGRNLRSALLSLIDHRTGVASIDVVLIAVSFTVDGMSFSRAMELAKLATKEKGQ